MKTWRSVLDYAFLGDEGVLVVMVGNQMLRMMEDIPEKVSNSAVNTLAGITPEQPSSPPQTRAERIKQLETERDAYLAEDAAGGDTPTPLVDKEVGEVASTDSGCAFDAVNADFARDLERVARMMAEALKNADIVFGHDAERRNALASWRELEERK